MSAHTWFWYFIALATREDLDTFKYTVKISVSWHKKDGSWTATAFGVKYTDFSTKKLGANISPVINVKHFTGYCNYSTDQNNQTYIAFEAGESLHQNPWQLGCHKLWCEVIFYSACPF